MLIFAVLRSDRYDYWPGLSSIATYPRQERFNPQMFLYDSDAQSEDGPRLRVRQTQKPMSKFAVCSL